MLSEERIAKLEAMSAEDMSAEIAKRDHSVFNEESRRYMQGRLARLGQREAAEAKVAQAENQAKTDKVGTDTLHWTKIGVLIAVIGIAVAVALARCT